VVKRSKGEEKEKERDSNGSAKGGKRTRDEVGQPETAPSKNRRKLDRK
jgi:hypothetical protein